ncbi:hypothetical protein JY651_09235 [Pyxidicoccus parkwayensis]|uniref:Uncharacterized protein n=2 Tax=Pyxidicoccus parkwayensis TaxID=2813578 RepID=A0ABX7PBV9_9BACT|nr:hypothetical protein JY651_09235 [Pyxidicoccus parkwaysis]
MTVGQLQDELRQGGRFVVFEYCISIVVMTFKRSSDVYFIRAGEGTTGKSIGYTLVSLLLGWWGIPWGFIYTPMALITNLGGGKDVTEAVVSSLLATVSQRSDT